MDDLSQVDANNTDESVVEEGQVDQNTNNNWDPIVEDEDEEDDDWPITEETEEAESEAEPESDKEEEDQFPEDEDEDEDADKESKDEDEWELKAFDHEEKVVDLERKKELAQKGLAYELRVDQLKQQRQQLAGDRCGSGPGPAQALDRRPAPARRPGDPFPPLGSQLGIPGGPAAPRFRPRCHRGRGGPDPRPLLPPPRRHGGLARPAGALRLW